MEPVYAITWIWQLQKAARIKTMKFSTSESRKLPLKVRKRQSLFLPDLRDLVAICGTAEGAPRGNREQRVRLRMSVRAPSLPQSERSWASPYPPTPAASSELFGQSESVM